MKWNYEIKKWEADLREKRRTLISLTVHSKRFQEGIWKRKFSSETGNETTEGQKGGVNEKWERG